MGRLRLLLVPALVTALFGCGTAAEDTDETPSPESTPETTQPQDVLVTGSWRDSAGGVWRFSDDGTYSVQTGLYETGVWSYEDGVLTITTDPDTRYCAETTGVHRLDINDAGSEISVEVVEDECEDREHLDDGPLEQREQ